MNFRVLSVSSRTPLQKGVAVGITTLALGFGAMSLLWRFGKWDPEVPGLWDYRSATIGDGVLLPLLSGALIAEIAKLHPARHERIIASSLAVTGMVTGWIVVRSWLTDPESGDNWTQANGVLNAAGTYHLIFLMLASGMFAALFAVLALRLRSSSPDLVVSFLRSRSLRVIIASLVGFTGMAVIDNIEGDFTPSNMMSVASVVGGTALVLVVLAVARRRYRVVDLSGDLWAVANAASILALSDVMVRKGAGSPGFAMVVALCVSVGASLDSRYRGDRFWAERILPSAVVFWAGMSIVGTVDVDVPFFGTLLNIVLIGLTVLAGTTVSGYWKWGQTAWDSSSQPPIWALFDTPLGGSVSPMFALLAVPVIWGALANLLSHQPEAFGSSSAILLGATLSLLGARMANVGTRYYREFVINQELVRRDAWMKWAVLISFAFSIFISLLWIVTEDMHGSSGRSESSPQISFLWIPVIFSVVAGTIGVAKTSSAPPVSLLGHHGRNHQFWSYLIAFVTFAWGISPWTSQYSVNVLSEIAPWTSADLYRVLVAMYLAVGIGITASKSIHHNGLRLQLLDPNRHQRMVMLVAGIAVSSMWYWLLAVGLWRISLLDHWRFFTMIGVVYASTIAICVASTVIVHQSGTSSIVRTVHDPANNSFQDIALFGALVGFSYFAFRSLGAALEDFSEAIQQVNTLLGFGFPILIAYLYQSILGNNRAHLKTMHSEVQKDVISWTIQRGVKWTSSEKSLFLGRIEAWILQQERLAKYISPSIPLMLMWKRSEENDTCQTFKHIEFPSVAEYPIVEERADLVNAFESESSASQLS